MEGNFTFYDKLLSIRNMFSRREGGYAILYEYSNTIPYGYRFVLLKTELKEIRHLNFTQIIDDIAEIECKADIGVDFKYYCLTFNGRILNNQLTFVEIIYLQSVDKFQFKKISLPAFHDYNRIYAYSKVDFIISLDFSRSIHLLLFNIEVNNKQSGVYGEAPFWGKEKWNIHNNSLIIVNETNNIRNLMILNVSQFIPESK